MMPIQARLRDDSLFVDNVDFKRAARLYLRYFESPGATPPKDLSAAMEHFARFFGKSNLHEITALARQAGNGAVLNAPTESAPRRGLAGNPDAYARMLELGYEPEHITVLADMMASPSGLVAFGGIAGSGMSTSMIAASESLLEAVPGLKSAPLFRFLERYDADPFEQRVLDVMRRNSDIIMLDEIRDDESAAAAAKLVNAGYKVLTTIHAESAVGILHRLRGLSLETKLITSTNLISGLVHQVLVKTLCSGCKVAYAPSLAHVQASLHDRIGRVLRTGDTIFVEAPNSPESPNRCAQCDGRGYIGRTACVEMVIPDSEMLRRFRTGDLVRRHLPPRLGMTSMADSTEMEHAISKMKRGLVSPDAVESELGFLPAKFAGDPPEYIVRGVGAIPVVRGRSEQAPSNPFAESAMDVVRHAQGGWALTDDEVLEHAEAGILPVAGFHRTTSERPQSPAWYQWAANALGDQVECADRASEVVAMVGRPGRGKSVAAIALLKQTGGVMVDLYAGYPDVEQAQAELEKAMESSESVIVVDELHRIQQLSSFTPSRFFGHPSATFVLLCQSQRELDALLVLSARHDGSSLTPRIRVVDLERSSTYIRIPLSKV
jgi:hypothetical protein